jgi:preprotein translocase subunit SecG
MALVRLTIWLVTAFFVVMMFYPLVTQMLSRLALPVEPEIPY